VIGRLFAVSGEKIIDGFALLQSLLDFDQLVDAVNNELHELTLGFLQTRSVGDIIDVIDRVSMFTARATLLKMKSDNDVIELRVLGELVQL